MAGHSEEFLRLMTDAKIKIIDFHCPKKAIDLNNVDIEKILIYDESAHGKKKEIDSIGYTKDEKTRPLVVRLHEQVNGYRHELKKNKNIFPVVAPEKLLEKYKSICDKISSTMEKEFN